MREKAPTFLSEEYQEVVKKAMDETRGSALPNFLSPQLHSNLVTSELRELQSDVEAVLNKSRKLWDDVMGTFFIFVAVFLFLCYFIFLFKRDFVRRLMERFQRYPIVCVYQ